MGVTPLGALAGTRGGAGGVAPGDTWGHDGLVTVTPGGVGNACLSGPGVSVSRHHLSSLYRPWLAGAPGRAEQQQPPLGVLAALTAGMVYLQLILGALMRHMGAGLAIPDFPLAFGRLVPPLETSAVVVHFLHRLGALAVTLCVGWLMARILRQYRAKKRLLRPAVLLVGLVLL